VSTRSSDHEGALAGAEIAFGFASQCVLRHFSKGHAP
jgi:hypothetical protein